jgi:hypothetical protein
VPGAATSGFGHLYMCLRKFSAFMYGTRETRVALRPWEPVSLPEEPTSSTAPQTAAEYWDKYKPYQGARDRSPALRRPASTGPVSPGTGLGPNSWAPKTALDLGPAEDENAAFLARRGVEVTAVDFSPLQTARARAFWGDLPGLTFVEAEACTFLEEDTRQWDAIYSTWGAVWFSDPEDLFPPASPSVWHRAGCSPRWLDRADRLPLAAHRCAVGRHPQTARIPRHRSHRSPRPPTQVSRAR